MDNNNKDYFDVDFLLAQPLEYILEETLGGKCLVHNSYMHNIGCCDTYAHFCYNRNKKSKTACYKLLQTILTVANIEFNRSYHNLPASFPP